MNVTITKLDQKWFPRECCGSSYTNAKTFMDHFLPTHQVEALMHCGICKREPSEIQDYIIMLEPGQTADQFVQQEEGTLDVKTGVFLCDHCYIKAGTPSAPYPNRWTATPGNLAALGVTVPSGPCSCLCHVSDGIHHIAPCCGYPPFGQ